MGFLFYLIPSLFDYVLYGIFFIVGYRLAESGAGALTASSPMAVWGIIYALSAPLVGRITTEKNAGRLLCLSGWGTAVCSLLFILCKGVWAQLLLVGAMGVISALYCVPFQVRAGASRNGTSPERAAGLYTFSWSMGTAAGSFGFGCLPDAAGFCINALIGILMVVFIRQGKKYEPRNEGKASPVDGKVPERMPQVWLFCGTAAFCMALTGALLPLRGVELQTGVFLSGALLAVIRLVQGLLALAMIRGPHLMWGRGVFMCGTLTGVGGLLCWFLGSSILSLFAGAVLFGLCGGIFYFSLVFHALSHREKSGIYLGINELIIGVTGIAGPVVGGMAAQPLGVPAVFGICALLLCIAGTMALMLIPSDKIFQNHSETIKERS